MASIRTFALDLWLVFSPSAMGLLGAKPPSSVAKPPPKKKPERAAKHLLIANVNDLMCSYDRKIQTDIAVFDNTIQYNTIQWKICTQKLTNKLSV